MQRCMKVTIAAAKKFLQPSFTAAAHKHKSPNLTPGIEKEVVSLGDLYLGLQQNLLGLPAA